LARPALRFGRTGAWILGDPLFFQKDHAGSEKGRPDSDDSVYGKFLDRGGYLGWEKFRRVDRAGGQTVLGDDLPPAQAGRICDF